MLPTATCSSPMTRSPDPPPPSSEPADQLRCITHPITGQLMAPGSKVWSYFVDHPNFGRVFAGPKTEIPERFDTKLTSRIMPAEVPARAAEAGVKAEKKKRSYKKRNKDQRTGNEGEKKTAEKPVNLPNPKKPSTVVASQPQARPADDEQIMMVVSTTARPIVKPITKKSQSQAHVNAQYADLIQRNALLRLKGRTDESHIIQAAINVGTMLGWNKVDVLDVVEKLERMVLTRKGQRQYSSRMMEVIGEIERFRTNEWSKWSDLRQLRENFKGRFYDGIGGIEVVGTGTQLRAPGFMMLLQAAINVAFLRGLELAVEDGEKFHDGVFDGKVVLFFRVPNEACVEEKGYLMQMSRLGTAKNEGRKVAACPGIERAIKEDERRMVVEGVRDRVEGGRDIIKTATVLFRKSTALGSLGEGESLTLFVMENLDDEGVLALDHIYRKKVGFPILVGDIMNNDEEEEEEDEEMDEPSSISLQRMQIIPGHDTDTRIVQVTGQKPSLIVKLKCRKLSR